MLAFLVLRQIVDVCIALFIYHLNEFTLLFVHVPFDFDPGALAVLDAFAGLVSLGLFT